MAHVSIYGTQQSVSASVNTFEAGEYHRAFVTLTITTPSTDTVTFFFNNLKQASDLVIEIAAKLEPLTATAISAHSEP